MIIGIPIYEKVDLLDVTAAVEIFNSMKANAPQLGIEIVLTAENAGEVLTRAGYAVAQQVQQFTQYYPCPPVASVIPGTDSCPLDEP